MSDEIDLIRLAADLNYWKQKAPDDSATHFCTISGGFEYLDAGEACDIPKPGTGHDDFVPMPKSVEQAKAMTLIGMKWLESNAPEQLITQPAVPEETEAMVDAAVKVFEDAGARVDLGWLGEACRAYVAASFTPTTPKADGCPECGSTDLAWHTQSSVTTGTPDGKLRANEVSTLFVLGCGHCSETIKTLTADQVAENMSPQPPVEQEDGK